MTEQRHDITDRLRFRREVWKVLMREHPACHDDDLLSILGEAATEIVRLRSALAVCEVERKALSAGE